MQREQESELWEREWAAASSDASGASVAEFVQFLRNHPWIAKKLKEKPSLANDQDFLHDNPGLRAYLRAHPVFATGVSVESTARDGRSLRARDVGAAPRGGAMRGGVMISWIVDVEA